MSSAEELNLATSEQQKFQLFFVLRTVSDTSSSSSADAELDGTAALVADAALLSPPLPHDGVDAEHSFVWQSEWMASWPNFLDQKLTAEFHLRR